MPLQRGLGVIDGETATSVILRSRSYLYRTMLSATSATEGLLLLRQARFESLEADAPSWVRSISLGLGFHFRTTSSRRPVGVVDQFSCQSFCQPKNLMHLVAVNNLHRPEMFSDLFRHSLPSPICAIRADVDCCSL